MAVLELAPTGAEERLGVSGARQAEVARWLTSSRRLCRRRFELLEARSLAGLFSGVQGREPGDSTTPAGLVELISSIATVGVLQPILVEELDGGLRLVAGERRLRAVMWGAHHLGGNPHFEAIPAVMCPGPLSEHERRTWQLVENLAREDLTPGELAAALLFERAAVLAAKLLDAGVDLPGDLVDLDDPVARFRALDRARVSAGLFHVGAPWDEVLRRLGIQMREAKARALVRAFAALPAELTAEMDEAKVALATRLEYLQLARGRADAADELWAAVKEAGRPELLHGAVREQMQHPELEAGDAVERAGRFRDEACVARAQAQRGTGAGLEAVAGQQIVQADREVVTAALGGLRALACELRAGRVLTPYDAGSLRMLTAELAGHHNTNDDTSDDGDDTSDSDDAGGGGDSDG